MRGKFNYQIKTIAQPKSEVFARAEEFNQTSDPRANIETWLSANELKIHQVSVDILEVVDDDLFVLRGTFELRLEKVLEVN